METSETTVDDIGRSRPDGPRGDPSPGRAVDRAGNAAPRAPTRLSATWTAVVVAVVVLVALVIFIAQNTRQSTVNFLWAHGRAPTAVLLLIAALAGAVIVVVTAAARMLQLRKRAGRPRVVGTDPGPRPGGAGPSSVPGT